MDDFADGGDGAVLEYLLKARDGVVRSMAKRQGDTMPPPKIHGGGRGRGRGGGGGIVGVTGVALSQEILDCLHST